MSNNQIQLTKAGLEALKKELVELVETKRPKTVERLSHARSQGDLKENSDYQNAKEELGFLDGKIEELAHVIKTAQVVSVSKNGDVGVGTKVTVKINGAEQTFEIVGDWEADPINKKISHTSPLGTALSGKKKGEQVEVEAPAGKILYEIVDVN
ncbi:transcription elongation factor GreA [Candidatus Microgenomates bacterium]|nr:transcription elongation factor GreA [Candidatus Microgenomates bacterium]